MGKTTRGWARVNRLINYVRSVKSRESISTLLQRPFQEEQLFIVSLIFAVWWPVRQLTGHWQLQRRGQVCPHQEQDLRMPN